MSKNAQVFGTSTVVLDEVPVDGVLQVFIKGEAEPRMRLYADGTIKAGNGAAAPAVANLAAPTAWVAAAALMTAEGTSWTDLGSGYQPVRYRMKGTDAELEGVIHGGASASVAFHLPAGFRPAMNQRFTVDASGGPALVIITPAGQVSINDLVSTTSSVTTFVSLTGIRFSTL